MRKNLEQLRAENAFKFIEKVQNKKEIMDIAKRLPTMFHTNGLLATFAFLLKNEDKLKMKKDGMEINLIDNLIKHLKKTNRKAIPDDFKKEMIFNGDNAWIDDSNFETTDFFIITDEMIKYATWLKRAAEALATDQTGG